MSLSVYEIKDKPLLRGPDIDQGMLDDLDLTAHLGANVLPGVNLGERRLGDYSLSILEHDALVSTGYAVGFHEISRGCVYPARLDDGNFYKIYINARKAVALNYRGVPNAVTAISMGSTEAMVTQIQGVRAYRDVNMAQRRRSSRGLAPLEWSGLMVDISEDVARRLGANIISIGTADTIKANHFNGNLNYERAIRIYDETASKKGYARVKHYWRKEL